MKKVKHFNKAWRLTFASLFLSILFLFFSCCKDDLEIKPTGGLFSIPVYNQAYQENYQADVIADLLVTAKNGYVLIDPYEDQAYNSVAILKANGNEVGAYISIGTGEEWRSDFNQLKPFLVSKEWGAWPGEYFVSDVQGAIEVMKLRIDQLALWGFDWVEFDNMDWVYDDNYRAKYKFSASIEEGQDYYNDLCAYAHSKGLKCMAKNTVEMADDFDGVLYESYRKDLNWWQTEGTKTFLASNKLVIINHYDECACNQTYQYYLDEYGQGLSFICEDKKLKKYIHFNE